MPAGIDPEAERLAADSWTKSTRRPVSTGPVEVASDNAFAALGLPERLVERLARDGITEPFPIQAAAIPDGLTGRDVLGRGRTGSGKTLAFGLPTVTRLAADAPNSAPRRPRALVLVPTRELAMQVSDALEPFVHVMGLRHKLVAGGLSYTTQIAALNRGVDLLIATPDASTTSWSAARSSSATSRSRSSTRPTTWPRWGSCRRSRRSST